MSQFDADLELRASGGSTITSTASTTGVAFNPRSVREYTCVIGVESLDETTGDETYDIAIQGRQSPDGAWVTIPGLSFTQIATASPAGEQLPTAANAGNLAIPRFVRAQMVSAGTTPILTATIVMEYSAPRGPGPVVDHGAVS